MLNFFKKLMKKKNKQTKELHNMNDCDILDIEADMKVTQTMLETEGYSINKRKLIKENKNGKK